MDQLKLTRVVLSCGVCGDCPAVEISPEAVTIGEDDNIVRLTHAQWNDLIARVRAGELGEVKA
jgi:hypothetical protein